MLFRVISIFKKGMLSPVGIPGPNQYTPRHLFRDRFEKAFSRASLTAESAVVLPVFLVCMVLVLQYANVFQCAVRIGSAMTQTAEEMAVASYLTAFGKDSEGGDMLGAAVSAGYASAAVFSRTGNTDPIRAANLLLSSYMEENDRINLVMTWLVRAPVGMVRVPGSVFLQRSCVRGWVGRTGSSGVVDTDEHDHDHETVYVAENGVVYHTDRNCTHIRLSITPVSLQEALHKRNSNGGKYHPCELCGKNAGGVVFITKDGDRYHSSLECSGLKRTISEVHLDDVGNLRPCSRCAGG